MATVVGAGVTVFEALKAYDQLKAQGINIRVIDAYSVQPIDAATLIAAGKATEGVIITVEDHYAVGGLGDAVSEAVAPAGLTVRRLAVREMPRSGQPDELLDRYGISARHIVDAVARSRPEAAACSTDRVGARRGRHAGARPSSCRLRRSPAALARRARTGVVAGRQRLAFSYLDRIWLSAPDGKGGKALRPERRDVERDPAWSSDGRSIVFAADAGDGFDLVVASSNGGDARRLTTLPATSAGPPGRLTAASSSRTARVRPLAAATVVDAAAASPSPSSTTRPADDEQQGSVSPDGKRIAYVSDRESEDGDPDLWVRGTRCPGRAIA